MQRMQGKENEINIDQGVFSIKFSNSCFFKYDNKSAEKIE